jgi:ATP-binding cassette subfamily F protein uup
VHQAAAGSSAYATYLDARAERIDREVQEESTRKILARKELAWLRRGAPARSTKPKARLRSANEIVSGGPAPVGVRGSELQLGGGTARLGNQVVELEGVAQRFDVGGADELTVFEHVDLLIEPGARLAVVGPNGSGKSTLLDIIAGRTQPAAGTVKRGKTVVVGFADQHSSDLDQNAVVRELVAGPHREPDHRDRALLERFWFDTTAQYAPVRMLSGGERRRLQLVMVLATEPNLLILDEPTNDLDLDTLRSLEAFLDDWPGALVVASHDRAFLDRVADHVLAIDPGGSVRRVPGGVSGWLAERSGASPARAAASPTATKAPGTQPPAARRKASSGPSPSTIGRQLRETEQAMVKAQKRVDQLAERLATIDHSTVDHTEFTAVGTELAGAQAELDALESRWLELAELQST